MIWHCNRPIHPLYVRALRRQIETPYQALTEEEKSADRHEADLMLNTIGFTALVQALEAAEQCIADFIEVYKRDCARVVYDEAVKSLRSDALVKIRKALKEVRDSE